MNYELAKKLKEAGFPDKKVGEIVEYPEGKAFGIPTLSELIEACGNGEGNSFFELIGHFTHDFGWEAKFTTIISHEPPEEDVKKGWGETPEEAFDFKEQEE